uniref:Uncharacterized protein n=1 Tax=Coprothermobacter proteolyticus (strain ATCC 35245 / DSM 5265 / OCM 4 / BT) TaxID=309798 RepID=B5Y9I2_COPPD
MHAEVAESPSCKLLAILKFSEVVGKQIKPP